MGASPIEAMLHAIETYPLPVVAVVQGDAIAGGNELALHCDHVVASSAARFGMSLAQIGLAPSWFLCKKLMEVAGPVITKQILLLGDPVPAKRLYDLGVVAHVVEPGDLDKTAAGIVQRLADNAPLSLKAMKALINAKSAAVPLSALAMLSSSAKAAGPAPSRSRAMAKVVRICGSSGLAFAAQASNRCAALASPAARLA